VQTLITDALAGRFQLVLAEAMDRLSRDQEDIAGLYKRMANADVKIVTLSEGEVTHLHVGLKGTMNALFLKDLADKTRRGQRGRIELGKSGGGKTYGYDVVRQLAPNGEPMRGDRSINAKEAEVVRRIFRDYVAGKSPKRIATELNKVGARAPRDSGKRQARSNPESEWIVQEVPELRIFNDDLWNAAKTRQAEIKVKRGDDGREGENHLRERRRPKYLFSGLTKCAYCGGSYSMISADLLGCSTARNKGTCDNRTNIRRDKLEERVLNALRHHLMDPTLFKEFCNEFTREMNRLRMQARTSIEAAQSEIKRIDRELDKLMKLILASGDDDTPMRLMRQMKELEGKKSEFERFLANAEEPPPHLHPEMANFYRVQVGELYESLQEEAKAKRMKAADLLRSLVKEIILTRRAAHYRSMFVAILLES
jgi:DNA invertase Pin-like site-specific DNA recombinase